ncbi:MAG: S8 family serine peptidase [Planctomycetota bacterium]|nr:S8 family serine peptidase [Planctomycetota bacterium]
MRQLVSMVVAAGMAASASAGVLDPALSTKLASDGEAVAWVVFADKGYANIDAERAAIDQLAREANPAALRRRQLRRTDPGLFDARDLPIARASIVAVEGTGARVRVESRWFNRVSVRGTRAQLEAIAALPVVTRVERVATAIARRDEAAVAIDAPRDGAYSSRDTINYGIAADQLGQVNLPALHAAGFTGQGVIVGILDTGFIRTHNAFNNPAKPLRVLAERDFINNDNNAGQEATDPANQADHGTFILGTLASYLPGTLVGGAFDASYVLCKTEVLPTETPVEEDYFVAGLEFAEAQGADMVTASLGYTDWYTQASFDGQTAVTTKAVNIATANGVHFTVAAGNGGWDNNATTSTLGAPADAFDAITCGAVSSNGQSASFSSSGPTADGRVKPEVLARGVGTATVSPASTTGLVSVNGTSLSTPIVAGVVACIVQARPTWTVAQMRQYLIQNASRTLAGLGPDPLFVRGYGIVDAGRILESDCNANGVSDFTDILGTSSDRNNDNIPDECTRGCLADYNLDGFVTFEDVDDFVADFEAGRTTADANADQMLTFEDFDTMVTAFASGC